MTMPYQQPIVAKSDRKVPSDDHIASVALMTDPRIAKLITPERGRELLTMRHGWSAEIWVSAGWR
jgi:hypothetical protein